MPKRFLLAINVFHIKSTFTHFDDIFIREILNFVEKQRNDRRSMRPSLEPYKSSKDQVNHTLYKSTCSSRLSLSLLSYMFDTSTPLYSYLAFLKVVLDDTQKELHSTKGIIFGERVRAFQPQVEAFYIKQRLQRKVHFEL